METATASPRFELTRDRVAAISKFPKVPVTVQYLIPDSRGLSTSYLCAPYFSMSMAAVFPRARKRDADSNN
jgi:hypothetical protein